ncbi:MAG TPA: MarR family transcriptional regulator, partial [Microlunatus sp.]|nr:MarR family transcriptional regulator [Microlunatus sp.]
MTVEEGVRAMVRLTPLMVGRTKRARPPEELRTLNLAPRHLSMLGYLLLDGPMGVNQLAERLEVAPATVSLMVSELSRRGVITRTEDERDRRRTIVAIAEGSRAAVDGWLAKGWEAWANALE